MRPGWRHAPGCSVLVFGYKRDGCTTVSCTMKTIRVSYRVLVYSCVGSGIPYWLLPPHARPTTLIIKTSYRIVYRICLCYQGTNLLIMRCRRILCAVFDQQSTLIHCSSNSTDCVRPHIDIPEADVPDVRRDPTVWRGYATQSTTVAARSSRHESQSIIE